MIESLRKLRELKQELDERYDYRINFVKKLETLADFIDRYLDGVIDEVDEGIDRITELENEVDELNEKIEELVSVAIELNEKITEMERESE